MINKITNVFSEKELFILKDQIDKAEMKEDTLLGRKISKNIDMPETIKNKVSKIVTDMFDKDLSLSSINYVEYSIRYGTPNLPPHFDGDFNDLIFNFQLSSNTKWDLGLNLELYSLENNSALLFNPNEIIHWRPYKEFADYESISLIFFRFCKNIKQDYSYKQYGVDHPIFNEINSLINNLKLDKKGTL